MRRSKLWTAAAIAVLFVLIPSAAVAIFSSGSNSSTPAITGTNSGTGTGVVGRQLRNTGDVRGVAGSSESTSGRGVIGLATANSGVGTGVTGVSTGSNGTGVFGNGSSSTALGFPAGIVGISVNSLNGGGVVGVANLAGIVGNTFVVGDGSFAGLFATDVGISGPGDGSYGHLMTGTDGSVAGTCILAIAVASDTCPFQTPFAGGTTPIVVVTPTSTNGGSFAVTAADEDGFTLERTTVTGATTYNFVVVGINADLLGAEPPSPASPAQAQSVSGRNVRGLLDAHAPARGR